MKTTSHLFVFLLLLTTIGKTVAQTNPANALTVSFTEKEILINDSKCFNYSKAGNDFSISDLSGKEIIRGSNRKNVLGRFETVITFLQVDKTFTNKNIVGRNDLIMSLVHNKVIGPHCEIDLEKLNKFIADQNEQK